MLLCLDPSFTHCGCSIIDPDGNVVDAGTIVTEKTKNKLLRVADDDVRRITQIASQLKTVIQHYDIKGILAELPPSNSQSAQAAKGLAMAVATVTTIAAAFDIPLEWATPSEVKQAMTGRKDASKEDMMTAACKRYGWKITEKEIRSKKTGKCIRIDYTYHVLSHQWGKDKFEHVADSLGVMEALKQSNTVRMLMAPNRKAG